MDKLIKVINNSEDNLNNQSNISLIIEKLCIALKRSISFYLKNPSDKKKACDSIKTLITLIYIILYNIEKSENIILFFKINNFTLIKILIEALNVFKKDRDNISVANFIINICFDDLKKKIYSYQNDNLKEIYQVHVYSQILGNFSFLNEPFDEKNINFKNFMTNITEMKFDENIINLKKENSDIFCKNLIPLLLSTPNFDFISFFTSVINKHIEIIRKEYNDELTSLFRIDDVTNDLIKNLIIIFCNIPFMKSFYMLIPNEYLSKDEIIFNLEDFEKFLNNFITKLIESLPFIIKVLLAIIKNSVKEINSGEENYSVVYTVLIFNFFISPTILEFYGISMVEYRSLRQLSRILRNICFGKEFENNDKLSYFNAKIKLFNSFINEKFKKNIFDKIDIKKNRININKEINSLLVNAKNSVINGKSILLPSFCYQYYWENISNVINSIKNQNK